MEKTPLKVRRLTSIVVLLLLLVMLAVGFTMPTAAATSYCVAGSWQTPNAWDPAANPMTDDGDGTWSLMATIASAGSYEFKVLADCTFATTFPAGNNSWFVTSGADQAITFHFDTNTHSDGFIPSTNIVHVSGDTLPASFTAVGDWQGWDNANSATEIGTAGGTGQETLTYTIPTAGSYEAKITVTGGWDKQFTSAGRQTDGGVVNFSTSGSNESITVTLDTNTSRFRYVANGDGEVCAGDNNIQWSDLGHDSRDALYRAPGNAVPVKTSVKLRLRAAKGDLTAAQVRVWNDRADQQQILSMTRVASDDSYDWWQTTLKTGKKANVFYYRFIAIDCTDVDYYEDEADRLGGWGTTFDESPDHSWQITVYDPQFSTPDWIKNAVVYQIFPDRFRDGDTDNHVAPGTFFYNEAGGTIYRSADGAGTDGDWNTPICDPRVGGGPAGCQGSYSRNFYGGDLQGLLDKLDYLESLGVTAIYLNPIFESPSNHKYDTTDFSRIDNNFGNLKLFKQLANAVHQRGMYLILDGVFNHTSSDSIYFDRYERYATKGACEKVNSPFKDWYSFFPYTGGGDAPCAGNRDYPKWFGIFDSLPVLRTAEKPAQDLIFGKGYTHPNGVDKAIGPYWARWIDGWRLDVAPEVDHGIQYELTDGREPGANDYWEQFRKAVHKVNPDLYIVGEEWGLATSWTSGGVTGGVNFPDDNPGEWDATMNYQFSSALLSFWRDTAFSDNDHNSGSSAGVLTPLTPTALNERLLNLRERYAPEAFYAMMNLLGSHDTSRALFMLDHGQPTTPGELQQHPADGSYDWSDAITRLKGVALMQMTLPGAPTIYYGDEVGLVGQATYSGGKWEDDPYNRLPYPWLDESGTPFFTHLQTDTPGSPRAQLFAHYQTLIAARNAHEALRVGSFDPLLVADGLNVYVYGRKMADNSDAGVVFVNRSIGAHSIDVNVSGYLPFGAVFDDVLTETVESYTVGGDGILNVPGVPGRGGSVLVLTSTIAAPPARVTGLSASAGQSQVALTWTAANGADRYDVYRSLVNGGYEKIGDSTTLNYTDTNVVNGTRYFYVVVGVNTTNGLEGKQSKHVAAQPKWDLSLATLKLQWPFTITHIIGTNSYTESIFGRITITDVTDDPGQTSGIRAQVGFGPDAVNPKNAAWRWVEMSFNADADGADEFVGTLLPDTVGEFDYTVRFSSDDGKTWKLATERDGGGSPIGDLTVQASDDINRPSAPMDLTVEKTTSTAITLTWLASVDTLRAPAVDSYRVFRAPIKSGKVGKYAVIGTTPANTTTYIDSAVVTNKRYAYYVKAVDTSFNVSPRSNVVKARAENVMIHVTFITTIPAGTPDENIYIVGDQPVWGPWDPGLVSMTVVPGTTGLEWTYTTSFEEGTDIEFKHTRGTWEKVEKAANGFDEISHFVTVENQGNREMTVETTVGNWRDPYVVSTVPAEGATVAGDTTISVTWNKNMGAATQFSVTDASSMAVSGTYAHDGGTNTTTFTPDTPLPAGTYTVTVSGFSVGGDTQQVPTVFTFTSTGAPPLSLPGG